jgi:hypothetical protein
MRMRMKTWVLLAVAAMFASCTCRTQIPQQVDTATQSDSRMEELQAEGEQAPETEPKSEPEPEPEVRSQAEESQAPQNEEAPPAQGAPAVEPATAEPPPETEEEPPSAPAGQPPQEEPTPPVQESFVVTQEVYDKTFVEVEEFVRSLNEIIRRRDYDTWLEYLTEDYIRQKSDPEYLRQQSEMPLLKKNNIVLHSLQDYFQYVVVPSRSQATIDDIEFIDEDHVKAISSIRGTRGILYLLEREDGGWKIGVWE